MPRTQEHRTVSSGTAATAQHDAGQGLLHAAGRCTRWRFAGWPWRLHQQSNYCDKTVKPRDGNVR